MMYKIRRGDQEFGPYSGSDIQQYLATGNIVETDMVCAEGTDRWIPVKEILSRRPGGQQPSAPQPSAPAPSYSPEPAPAPQPSMDSMFDPAPAPQAPQFSSPSEPSFSAPAPSEPAWGAPSPSGGMSPSMGSGGGAPSSTMKNGAPLPPDMNWVIVLVISLVCGIFALVWFIMQVLWVKKIDAQNKTLPKVLIGFACIFGGAILSGIIGAIFSDSALGGILGLLVYLGGFVAYLYFFITGILDLRRSLEGYFNNVEPINLRLNPILMIFFAVFYMQYHFNRINAWKKTGVLPQ